MENFPIYRKIFLNCKYVNSSNFGRKFSDFSKLENFPPSANVPIHLILVEKFPPSPFGLKIDTQFRNFRKVGEVEKFPIYRKIFRFLGKFSSTENIPIHQIWEENFPIFPNWKIFHILQIFQFIWFYWKNFHLLHSVWKLAHLQVCRRQFASISISNGYNKEFPVPG